MIQREIIENKLRLLLGYLSELKDFLEITYEDYLSSNKNKRTIERLIELIVECGSDISGDILSLLNGTAPESYYKSFSLLGEKGVFEKDFADKNLIRQTLVNSEIISENKTVTYSGNESKSIEERLRGLGYID